MEEVTQFLIINKGWTNMVQYGQSNFLHFQRVILLVLALVSIPSAWVNAADNISLNEAKDLKDAIDMMDNLIFQSRIYKIDTGHFPDHWNDLKTAKNLSLPDDSKIENREEQSNLICRGWRVIILTRNVYGDKYNAREAFGIACFKENNKSNLNAVVCADNIIGIFIKNFTEGEIVIINKYCGVNNDSGVLGWTHIDIKPQR